MHTSTVTHRFGLRSMNTSAAHWTHQFWSGNTHMHTRTYHKSCCIKYSCSIKPASTGQLLSRWCFAHWVLESTLGICIYPKIWTCTPRRIWTGPIKIPGKFWHTVHLQTFSHLVPLHKQVHRLNCLQWNGFSPHTTSSDQFTSSTSRCTHW